MADPAGAHGVHEVRDPKDLDDLVASYLDLVEDEWVRGELTAPDRRRLSSELESDLVGALAGGAPASAVFVVEPVQLARDVASAEGLSLRLPAPAGVTARGLVGRGLGGALLAGFVTWFFLVPAMGRGLVRDTTPTLEVVSLVVLYVVSATVVLGGAAAAMAHYLRAETGRRRTVVVATVLMALFGSLSVAPCVGLGVLSNYSTAMAVIVLDAAVVSGFLATAILIAWSLHQRRARPSRATSILDGSRQTPPADVSGHG